MPVLIVFAVLVALVALAATSSATLGPSLMGFACLLAIFARLSQTAAHRRDRELDAAEPPPAVPVNPDPSQAELMQSLSMPER